MGLREQKKEIQRVAILQVTTDLFQKQGIADTSVNQIAEKALITVPTLYRYYETKHQLIFEYAQAEISKQDSRIEHFFTQLPLDLKEALTQWMQLKISTFAQSIPASHWRQILIAHLQITMTEQVKGTIEAIYSRKIPEFIELLKDKGLLRDSIEDETLFFLLDNTVTGFAFENIIFNELQTDPKRIDNLVDVMIRGLYS